MKNSFSGAFPFLFLKIFFNGRTIALQCCVGFCSTTILISHNYVWVGVYLCVCVYPLLSLCRYGFLTLDLYNFPSLWRLFNHFFSRDVYWWWMHSAFFSLRVFISPSLLKDNLIRYRILGCIPPHHTQTPSTLLYSTLILYSTLLLAWFLKRSSV